MSIFFKVMYAVVRFLGSLMAFLMNRRQIQAGEDRATARSLKEQARRVEAARAARRSVDPDSVSGDDPYCRD